MPPSPDVVVKTWHTEEKPCATLKADIEKLCSYNDENPPHRTIYTGTLGTLERYHWMAHNNNEIAFPGSAFDAVSPTSNNPSIDSAAALSPESSSSGAARHPKKSARVKPCKPIVFFFGEPFIYSIIQIPSQREMLQNRCTAGETSSTPSSPPSCLRLSLLGPKQAEKLELISMTANPPEVVSHEGMCYQTRKCLGAWMPSCSSPSSRCISDSARCFTTDSTKLASMSRPRATLNGGSFSAWEPSSKLRVQRHLKIVKSCSANLRNL